MKYKGTLIVVKDCKRALKFYSDMFGFQLLKDNDGNMELTNNIYLQELGYWEQFTKRSIIPNSNILAIHLLLSKHVLEFYSRDFNSVQIDVVDEHNCALVIN